MPSKAPGAVRGARWWSRLRGGATAPARPSGESPERYLRDRTALALKAVLAAVLAWLIARYALGQPNPYFAPLAATLSVYPTVARSLLEGAQYAGGFLIGAALAVPVGMLIGPNTAGIAVVVLVSIAVSSWRRLGDQGGQVAFTALFVLLFGGEQALGYALPRLADLGVGLAVGLGVNIFVLPPLHMRPAADTLARLGADVGTALERLAGVAADPGDGTWDAWRRAEAEMNTRARQARRAHDRAYESLRWNPRAAHRRDRPSGALIGALEQLTGYCRATGHTLRETVGEEGGRTGPAGAFGEGYCRLLRRIAPLVRRFAEGDGSGPDGLDDAWRAQHALEKQVADRRAALDFGDLENRLLQLTHRMLAELTGSETPGGR
ncbi:FUSC family protein [Allonocardiopsis opalescens]|uniref:Aromatic acid exporter family member 1 n=1 Tax=Allonocardiopsis opalescens TaxID=1144618 RepID=A0A2T0QE73_9ACTN|nr:aromatic acid exporter family protein [Allonocardiopsis opalescens]PRY02208.1 aromatic acid exporter family member 1 [Allonocardiopsis opalescens]